MAETEKIDILLKGVPKDVADELDRRADQNFRSRTGEILAILTLACRTPTCIHVLPADGTAHLVPVPLATGTPMVRELAPATSPATVQEV